MAICTDCGQEMKEATSCGPAPLLIEQRRFERTRYTGSRKPPQCGDCGVGKGGVHHFGCDMERCPRCGRQVLTCGCVDEAATLAWWASQRPSRPPPVPLP